MNRTKLLEGRLWTLTFDTRPLHWSLGIVQLNKTIMEERVHLLYFCLGPVELRRCNIPNYL